MMFTRIELEQLLQLAIQAALAAGQVIHNADRDCLAVMHKDVGSSRASQVVTEVDHQAQAVILSLLAPSCAAYDVAVLTEEAADDGGRRIKRAFWCIDPIDGTLAFVGNTPGYSVSIALVAQDGSPLIGVVYDPVSRHLYHAARGQGAYCDQQALALPAIDSTRPLILRTDASFSSHPWLEATCAGLDQLACEIGLNGAEVRYRVGAVMNACAILHDANLCYFKYPRSGDSGGSLWDYAATACLFSEAGAVASDIRGQPMELNRPDSTFMNHRGILYAGNRSLAEGIVRLCRAVAELGD